MHSFSYIVNLVRSKMRQAISGTGKLPDATVSPEYLTKEPELVERITYEWLRNKIQERLYASQADVAVIFAHTADIFDANTRGRIENRQGTSNKRTTMEMLDKLCEEHLYIMADYDKQRDVLSKWATYKTDHVSDQVRNMLNKGVGMLIVGK